MQKPWLMEITSVSQLVGFVEKRCSSLHLFRGQRQDKPLLPKIGRGDLKPDFLSEEQRLLSDFRNRSAPYLDTTGYDEWDLLAVAQHHGMATRLLDWTANPLAALWFAVRDDPKDGNDGVLWILPVSDDEIARQQSESPFGDERTKVFQPKHITKTIVAQSGWFTVHKYMGMEKEFIPLEDNKLYKGDCEKCRIRGTNFLLLRGQLNQFGVNASTMFPDLRGLCEYLNFTYLPELNVMRFPRTSTTEKTEINPLMK